MSPGDPPFDEDDMRAYLARELDVPPELEMLPAGGGNANETYLLTSEDRELVLRCPPTDEPAPEILHGVLREHEVLSALDPTSARSPSPVLRCEDASVVGCELYVMERVEGEVVDGAEPERFAAPDRRRRVAEETVDALAEIHEVDHRAVGLEDFAGGSDPREYAREQVEVLGRQLDWACSITAREREVPGLRRVGDWLSDNLPEPLDAEDVTLVHGDYKPDNLMFAPGPEPRITGVLDWEMSTLGDPLCDLGWLLSYWHEERDPDALTPEIERTYEDHDYYPMLEVYVDDYSRFMEHEDYPSRRDLVERYERRTGSRYRNDRFYRALAVYKLACICEGFYRLHLEGSESAKPTYPLMEMMVPVLAERARLIVEGEEPL